MRHNIKMADFNENNDGFFKTGLQVHVINGVRHCNAPGISIVETQNALKLCKFIISHHHLAASRDSTIINDFNEDCILDLLKDGGTLPHASVKDWLYFKGIKGELISS